MVYCRGCGLYMSSGFCLHGSVDEAIASQAGRDKHGKRCKGKGCKGC